MSNLSSATFIENAEAQALDDEKLVLMTLHPQGSADLAQTKMKWDTASRLSWRLKSAAAALIATPPGFDINSYAQRELELLLAHFEQIGASREETIPLLDNAWQVVKTK